MTNDNGIFELIDRDERSGAYNYADDDTRGMDRMRHDVPVGPRGADRAYKRGRLSY